MVLGQVPRNWKTQYTYGHCLKVRGVQLVKQQHMEENSRLRATLEEWSHRNAKLEHRLNQAKQRIEDLQAKLAGKETSV